MDIQSNISHLLGLATDELELDLGISLDEAVNEAVLATLPTWYDRVIELVNPFLYLATFLIG